MTYAFDTEYLDDVVTRSAPRWAWEIIDETLAMDAQSKAFDRDLREDIQASINAMGHCCENPNLETLSREEADDV